MPEWDDDLMVKEEYIGHGMNGRVHTVANLDTNVLVSASTDNTIRVWNSAIEVIEVRSHIDSMDACDNMYFSTTNLFSNIDLIGYVGT